MHRKFIRSADEAIDMSNYLLRLDSTDPATTAYAEVL